jgi:hypothetical protein
VEEPRLPAHLEVAALIRRAQAEGGFATVLHKGDREAGTIMLVLCQNGANSRGYERMPTAEGTREWRCSRTEVAENPREFSAYLHRRQEQDPDMWIVELDVAQAERLIGLPPPSR